MFMMYLHTKFHLPSYSGSSVIAAKLKTKEIFHKATLTEAPYFSLTYYYTSFQDTILISTTVTPTSEVCVSDMLLLLIVQGLGGIQWCNIHTKIHENWLTSLTV
jgi:hypothetical protein